MADLENRTTEESAPEAPETQEAEAPESAVPETRRDQLAAAYDSLSEDAKQELGDESVPKRPVAKDVNRQSDGKFAKGPKSPSPPPGEREREAPATKRGRDPNAAPQSWSIQERALWEKIPAEARAPIMRREAEMNTERQRMQPAVAAARDLLQTAMPYQGLFAALGVNPIQFLGQTARTLNYLHNGTPDTKLHVIGDIVERYLGFGDEGMKALDRELTRRIKGEPAPTSSLSMNGGQMQMQSQAYAQQQPLRDPRLDQIMQQAQANMDAAANSELDEYQANPENMEFYEDLKPHAIAALKAYQENNIELSIADAFEVAKAGHPEVRAALAQRAEAEAARRQQGFERSARASALRPAMPPIASGGSPVGNSRRDQLQAAWDELTGAE